METIANLLSNVKNILPSSEYFTNDEVVSLNASNKDIGNANRSFLVRIKMMLFALNRTIQIMHPL